MISNKHVLQLKTFNPFSAHATLPERRRRKKSMVNWSIAKHIIQIITSGLNLIRKTVRSTEPSPFDTMCADTFAFYSSVTKVCRKYYTQYVFVAHNVRTTHITNIKRYKYNQQNSTTYEFGRVQHASDDASQEGGAVEVAHVGGHWHKTVGNRRWLVNHV